MLMQINVLQDMNISLLISNNTVKGFSKAIYSQLLFIYHQGFIVELFLDIILRHKKFIL